MTEKEKEKMVILKETVEFLTSTVKARDSTIRFLDSEDTRIRKQIIRSIKILEKVK